MRCFCQRTQPKMCAKRHRAQVYSVYIRTSCIHIQLHTDRRYYFLFCCSFRSSQLVVSDWWPSKASAVNAKLLQFRLMHCKTVWNKCRQSAFEVDGRGSVLVLHRISLPRHSQFHGPLRFLKEEHLWFNKNADKSPFLFLQIAPRLPIWHILELSQNSPADRPQLARRAEALSWRKRKEATQPRHNSIGMECQLFGVYF